MSQQVQAELILLVEDDAGISELVKDKLEEHGKKVVPVTSGEAAREWLGHNRPDLVLLDYSLPDLSGLELVAQLEAAPDGMPPFIVTTGFGDERLAVSMMKRGARDYLVKDRNFLEALPLVVEQVLGQMTIEYKLAETEQALRESEAFNQAIIFKSPIGVSVRSHTGQLLSANAAWKKIWAIPDTDVQEDMSRERETLEFDLRDDYLRPHLAEIRRIYEEGGYLHLPELKTTHPRPGAAEWVSQHFYAINNEQGQVDRVVILTEDITERKKAEEKLRATTTQLKTLIQVSPLAIVALDADGNVQIWNPAAEHIFGWSTEEIMGFPNPIVPGDKQEEYSRLSQQVLGGQPLSSLEVIRQRKDGSHIPVSISTATLQDEEGNITGRMAIVADDTERKQSEEALREREALYRQMFTSHAAVMLLIDPDSGQIVEANPAAADFYGYPLDDLQKMKIEEINTLPPDKVAKYRRAAKERKQNYFLFQHRLASGEIRDVEVHSVPIQLEGRILLYSIIHDITERKQAEDSLLESEERFYKAFHASPVVMSISSLEDGTFLDANAQFFNLTGLKREETIGRKSTELGLWSDSVRDEVLTELKETGFVHNKEVELITKSGKVVPLLWFGDVVHINNEPCLITSGYDLTERKRSEQALRESEERFRQLFEESSVGIYIHQQKNLQNKIYANAAFAKFIEYSRQEIEEMHPQHFMETVFHPEILAKERPLIQQLFAGEIPNYQIEKPYIKKSGKHVYGHVSVSLISDKAQNSFQVIAVVQNVTESKRAEEELHRNSQLNAALAALYPPLVMPDSNIQDIARIVLEQARNLTESEHGYVSEIDPITGDNIGHTLTEMLAGQCQVQGEERRIVFPRNADGTYNGLWGHALNTKQAFYTNNPADHPASTGAPSEHIPLDCFLSVPVMLGDELVGHIALSNTSNEYTEYDLESIKRLAEYYALAIQRKRAEEALGESEHRHRTMIANISDVVAVMDKNGIIKYKSPNIERHFGWRPEDLVGTNGWDTVHSDDLGRIQKEFFALFEKENAAKTVEYRYKRKDGAFSLIELTAANLVHDPKINGILMNYHDITERKRIENELKKQKSFFEQAFIQSATSTQILDEDGWCLRINPKLSELFGVKPEHIEGGVYNIFRDEEIKRNGIDTILKRVFENQKVENWEVHFDIGIAAESQNIEVEQKKKVWYSNKAYPIVDEAGKLTHVIIQHDDISERKEAEEAMRAALQDKEVLLRELYHRTKNNMQVVSSMLNLEMDRIDDQGAQKILQDMDNRIRSMALVHQKLYQSQNLSSLDLKDYIADLVSLLLESYQTTPDRINFSMQAESIPVVIDIAIPCGLIINEILSNSLKYAFPGNKKGNIYIRLEQAKDATIILEISDDGVGVPPEKNLRQSNTLGMQTIFGIAGHQLNAKVDLKTSHGVTWCVQFSNNLYTSRV